MVLDNGWKVENERRKWEVMEWKVEKRGVREGNNWIVRKLNDDYCKRKFIRHTCKKSDK